ncbi:siderophore-interacting protein [Streptomyces hoynatensis]|uniref:Siderophore-interacting protein n=1 Tax=Streptomyces hoynatensis TaxID=1141874 RepID=A0A3A9YSS0_9ACTN|nr:siderophore-interacting protein [Streptomyces hoynatensis]RKN39043.1 siderophore-interacting protein [Streptomyces hoynatensis]
MSERETRRKPRTVHVGRVLRTERVSPHMIRVVFGGEGLSAFGAGAYTDHYVKLLFPAPGVTYPEPFDIGAIRERFPRESWPRTRTYTVRAWDEGARELTIDFVHHGESGLAGPWAAAARPGDELRLLGPGGGYAPDPAAAWHLLAGDESALPAIGAALERLPAGARARAFVEVEGPEEEQKFDTAGEVDLVWLHRGTGPVGAALVAAVTGADFAEGPIQAFVHGEATFVKELRRHLRHDRGLAREQLSISGYWRLGTDEDGWQAGKAEWNRRIEEEQEAPRP